MRWHLRRRGSSMKQVDVIRVKRQGSCAGFVLAACVSLTTPSHADEGGVSFWVPGIFGSLAAAPQTPGWSVTAFYYHTTVNAGADVAFARQVSVGRLTTNFTGNLNANLKANADSA